MNPILEQDLARVAAAMRAEVESEIPLIADVGAHTLHGGKRLRAAVALLSASICGVEDGARIPVAAAIEFIHSATLLHDDVVDCAPRRRRRASANRVFGNAAAVLVGDFLYSRASQMLAATGSARMLARIADATNRLAEGEVLQLVGRGRLSRRDYFRIVERKTANLFEAAAAAGAILGAKDEWEAPLATFGRRLGTGFQMIDDCLDYAADGADTGKDPGRDFAEGKITLPLICALENAADDDARRLRAAVAAFGESASAGRDPNPNADADAAAPIAFAEVAAIVRQSGALQTVRAQAAAEIQAACAALDPLPSGTDKTRLMELARQTAARTA